MGHAEYLISLSASCRLPVGNSVANDIHTKYFGAYFVHALSRRRTMSTRSRSHATRARRNLLKTAGLAAAGGLVFDRLANAADANSKHFERKAVHAEVAPAADI